MASPYTNFLGGPIFGGSVKTSDQQFFQEEKLFVRFGHAVFRAAFLAIRADKQWY